MINGFDAEYAFLSNFYDCPVMYNGLKFLNTEAAFQAAKCLNEAEAREFCFLPPNQAKRRGRRITLRPDWEAVKYDIMLEIVRCKFTQNVELQAKLLATGDEELVEGNWWHDNIWGNCSCDHCINKEGKNWLGNILMQVRDELRKKEI